LRTRACACCTHTTPHAHLTFSTTAPLHIWDPRLTLRAAHSCCLSAPARTRLTRRAPATCLTSLLPHAAHTALQHHRLLHLRFYLTGISRFTCYGYTPTTLCIPHCPCISAHRFAVRAAVYLSGLHSFSLPFTQHLVYTAPHRLPVYRSGTTRLRSHRCARFAHTAPFGLDVVTTLVTLDNGWLHPWTALHTLPSRIVPTHTTCLTAYTFCGYSRSTVGYRMVSPGKGLTRTFTWLSPTCVTLRFVTTRAGHTRSGQERKEERRKKRRRDSIEFGTPTHSPTHYVTTSYHTHYTFISHYDHV